MVKILGLILLGKLAKLIPMVINILFWRIHKARRSRRRERREKTSCLNIYLFGRNELGNNATWKSYFEECWFWIGVNWNSRVGGRIVFTRGLHASFQWIERNPGTFDQSINGFLIEIRDHIPITTWDTFKASVPFVSSGFIWIWYQARKCFVFKIQQLFRFELLLQSIDQCHCRRFNKETGAENQIKMFRTRELYRSNRQITFIVLHGISLQCAYLLKYCVWLWQTFSVAILNSSGVAASSSGNQQSKVFPISSRIASILHSRMSWTSLLNFSNRTKAWNTSFTSEKWQNF